MVPQKSHMFKKCRMRFTILWLQGLCLLHNLIRHALISWLHITNMLMCCSTIYWLCHLETLLSYLNICACHNLRTRFELKSYGSSPAMVECKRPPAHPLFNARTATFADSPMTRVPSTFCSSNFGNPFASLSFWICLCSSISFRSHFSTALCRNLCQNSLELQLNLQGEIPQKEDWLPMLRFMYFQKTIFLPELIDWCSHSMSLDKTRYQTNGTKHFREVQFFWGLKRGKNHTMSDSSRMSTMSLMGLANCSLPLAT